MEDHAMLLVQLADEVTHLRPEHAFERTLLGRHHVHLELARAQRGRDFEADEARADHHRALGAIGGLDDRAAVGKRAQRVHMRQVRTRNGKPHRLCAGRKQQAVVGDAAAVLERDGAVPHVDPADLGVQPQIDVVLLVEVVRSERQPVFGRIAGQIVLREVRAIDRRRVVAAEHRDGVLVALPAQHLGRRESGRAAADNDDAVRRCRCLAARPRFGLLHLLAHRDGVALPLDLPAGDRAQRRRVQRLAGAQIEAGVMPRAAHRAVRDDALGERPVIVRALRPDREHLRALPHQQHGFVADMSEQEAAVGNRGKRHAFGEIRACGFLLVGHGELLSKVRSSSNVPLPVAIRRAGLISRVPWTSSFPKSSAQSRTPRGSLRAPR